MLPTLLSLCIASLLLALPFAFLEPNFFFTAMAFVLTAGFACTIALLGEMWLRRVASRR